MQPIYVHQPPDYPGLVVAKLSENTFYVRMARVHSGGAVQFVVDCLHAETERFVIFLHFEQTLVMVRPTIAIRASLAVMQKSAGMVLLGQNRMVHVVATVLANRRITSVNSIGQAYGALKAFGAVLPPKDDFLTFIASFQPSATDG